MVHYHDYAVKPQQLHQPEASICYIQVMRNRYL
ncbi:unnamed protein product [Brugia pahangi]|uniref:AraC family transcriptional regulator n=1 Tax=Brugia pahangi TaxID=6280 RepID=A0A0N4TAD8_BRUPA|nr:unnamed protein product [Brugia pahangi]